MESEKNNALIRAYYDPIRKEHYTILPGDDKRKYYREDLVTIAILRVKNSKKCDGGVLTRPDILEKTIVVLRKLMYASKNNTTCKVRLGDLYTSVWTFKYPETYQDPYVEQAPISENPLVTYLLTVNNKELSHYFGRQVAQMLVLQPLKLTELDEQVDIKAMVKGGGSFGQAGAIRHGISRALLEFDESLRPQLKSAGLLTRDDRKVERKKPGLKKARKSSQFSKR